MGCCGGGRKWHHNQRYSTLRKQCIKSGEKFSDPKFPPHDSSLYFSKPPPGVVVWKRPHEIVDTPRLFIEGASSSDVTQGQLGNCWFVAACATLAGVRELWHKVSHTGRRQGAVAKGEPHWPASGSCGTNGNLNDISCITNKGGNLSDALVDLTGGVSAHLDLTLGGYTEDLEKRKTLFKMMRTEMDERALMCCAISCDEPLHHLQVSVMSLFTIFKGRQKLRMVRLKNPWGEKEWNGAFSDGGSSHGFMFSVSQLTRLCSRSPEWAKVSNAERESLGLVFEDDGEFWMTFEDFLEHFTDLSICFLINTSVLSLSKTWNESSFHSAWTIGVKGHHSDRSGGCLNHKESFLRNPQYKFDVRDDKEDVIVQLLQKDMRERRSEGVQQLVIGFHIMKVEVNREYRVHRIHASAATSDYIKTRSIFLREQLPKGRYVVVPTTFKPNETGDFLLRIFTSRHCDATELLQSQPVIPWYSCVRRPVIVTAVTVKSASHLVAQTAFGGEPDAYCIIKCEGETVRTPADRGTSNPKWDTTAIFYRARPQVPIVIEVWNKSLLMDGFMGRAELLAPVNTNSVQVELPLYGRRSEKAVLKEGVVLVQVYSDDDLQSI
ncbi:calpain-5 [Hyalella azteca]|uniref:Calpain-5 n=1 Tax=Hyalella azteca TaxID=294128 RepID=A0A979FRT5_HYAAZ|nr:calpain-5 [Hyalella azteca]